MSKYDDCPSYMNNRWAEAALRPDGMVEVQKYGGEDLLIMTYEAAVNIFRATENERNRKVLKPLMTVQVAKGIKLEAI